MIRNFLSALLATAAVFLCVNCSGSSGVATPPARPRRPIRNG